MLKSLRINYIFASDEVWSKIQDVCSELGWNKSSIVKQMIHGFFARYRDFYADAGIADARARGMEEDEYFRILRDESEQKLSPYLGERPNFGVSPIATIPRFPSEEGLRRAYNTIELGAYNFVLLRVARIVADDDMVQVISKVIVRHLADNWENTYLPQIERDKQCKFK